MREEAEYDRIYYLSGQLVTLFCCNGAFPHAVQPGDGLQVVTQVNLIKGRVKSLILRYCNTVEVGSYRHYYPACDCLYLQSILMMDSFKLLIKEYPQRTITVLPFVPTNVME